MKKTISVIIPSYNEEMCVGAVIASLLTCPSVSEIIAVNDGSSDQTEKILQVFKGKIKIISYPKNQGKGFAVVSGIKATSGEIVVFCDGHHLNIKDRQIKKMTSPLVKNQADVVLGTTISRLPDPFWRFTGFRAYRRKDLLAYLSQMSKERYGIEAYLNEKFKRKKQKVVYFADLIHLTKQEKMPASDALTAYIDQAKEMAQTLAKTRGLDPDKIGQILNPKKIKSIEILKQKIRQIKNKEILSLMKKYLFSYLNISS